MNQHESIRQQFRASLAELTFNSRPIIMSLTTIAAENAAFAGAIVQAIEDQLRIVTPKIKLPILYLMDSICKNVGPVYTRLFANNLVASFSNAYAAVSPEDRERFRKVVNTWKLPDVKTGGRAPLFDPALTRNLDTFMNNYRDGNNGAALNTGNVVGGYPSGYSNGVNNGRGLAPQQEQSRSNRSPQLSLPVVQPPPNQSLTSIVLQQQIQALLTQKQQAVLLNPQDTASRSQIPVLTQLLVHVSTSILSTADLQLISQSLTSMMATTNSLIPTPSLPPVSLPKIMPGLLEGFNSKSSSQISTTPSTASSKKEATLPRLSLSNADINKPLPNAHLILYDPSTNQCAQCGTRFPGTTDAGKKKYSAHLDWHFRQNKRLRENTRRRVCREWWLASDVWVSEDLTGNLEVDEDKSSSAAFFGDDAVNVAKVEKAEPEILHNIPAEGETNMQCGICKEDLEQYYDEAEDLWMIKGAVKVDGQLFHQLCYSMSVNGGNDGGSGGGTKRKADEVDLELKRPRV